MFELSKIAPHLIVTGGALFFLVVVFVVFFLVPGVLHWLRLRNATVGLASLKPGVQPEALQSTLKNLFAKDKQLAHLWDEYQDTLHVQQEERDGQLQVVAVRSTVLAETYFNEQFVVDSRLSTEFFKHLPGIFTGLGIIGTFFGLIEGLHHFQVSDNAATVRAGLESLMHAVGDAFQLSAIAIAVAMTVTFLEKLLLSALYGKTEAIAHGIDARFEAGAGEDYLSRLVSTSESSASQTKILKDALIKELGDILQKLTVSQIKDNRQLHARLGERIENSAKTQVESAREGNQQLGAVIAQSIQDSLRDSLAKIASVVEKASGDQSATAVGMLNDIMVSFSQRLNDLFGGQISGLNTLNQQTAQGMQEAVAALNTLVGKLEESGRKTTDDMAAQIAAAIQAMEARQTSINAQTEAFVAQIQQLVATSQTQTQQKLQATLEALGQQMATLLVQLGTSQATATSQTSASVSQMTHSVATAIQEIAAASKTMEQSVTKLTDATATSVNKMHQGADRLDQAATHFASAGDRVSAVMGQAATISGKLTELSGALASSANSLQNGLNDYKAQRDSVGELLREVRQTVELARKEASLTGDVLQRIEGSASKLGQAQKAADEYLDGVSDVLAKSSDAFNTSVTTTLAQVNHDFHKQLSTAVALLASSVQELEVTLAGVAPKH